MSDDADVETQLMLLETPFGAGPHQRQRENAAAWLLANAERAYPIVLARLETGRAGSALVELVPRFGRSESIAPLSRLLDNSNLAWSAGQALAAQPQPAAGEILRTALAGTTPAIAIVAADALAARGDRNDCVALVALCDSPDAGVRYHAVAAAAKLACLSADALQRLRLSDPDADVRALAETLLESH